MKNRRKALKAISASVPVAWATPVISSVIIPAHAACSGICVVTWEWVFEGPDAAWCGTYNGDGERLSDGLVFDFGGFETCDDEGPFQQSCSLAPGSWFLSIGGTATNGATVSGSITIECCDFELLTLLPTSGGNNSNVIVITEDGTCLD